jgi:hypothetical protein
MVHPRTLPAGFSPPCLPTNAPTPSGRIGPSQQGLGLLAERQHVLQKRRWYRVIVQVLTFLKKQLECRNYVINCPLSRHTPISGIPGKLRSQWQETLKACSERAPGTTGSSGSVLGVCRRRCNRPSSEFDERVVCVLLPGQHHYSELVLSLRREVARIRAISGIGHRHRVALGAGGKSRPGPAGSVGALGRMRPAGQYGQGYGMVRQLPASAGGHELPRQCSVRGFRPEIERVNATPRGVLQEDRLVDNPTGGNGRAVHEVAFDYVKSQFFRVIHADGIIGGPTPQGFLHFSFYSERPPLPRRMVHAVSPIGQLGEVIPEKTVVRDAIMREMDVDVIMRLDVAEQFHQWLGQRIQEMKPRPPEEGASA